MPILTFVGVGIALYILTIFINLPSLSPSGGVGGGLKKQNIMFKKLFSLFAALTLSVGLWAENSVITFTSTSKLYPVDIEELWADVMMEDGAKWAAFKAQYPEFAHIDNPHELKMMGFGFFNPNCFLDANGQVLNYTYNYDESTHAGTITVNGELVKIAGSAFSDCTALTSITLPEGLTSIGRNSFV